MKYLYGEYRGSRNYMSIKHYHCLTLPTQSEVEMELYSSINVQRTPLLKQQILANTLHTIQCPGRHESFCCECEFSYLDPDKNLYIICLPNNKKHQWQEYSQRLHTIYKEIPYCAMGQDTPMCRIVFGLDELREKIVIRDLSLDDGLLEILKVLIIYSHPVLITQERLCITFLGYMNEKKDLQFLVSYDHSDTKFQIQVSQELWETIDSNSTKVKDWLISSLREDIFQMKEDYWVSFCRWNPQSTALRDLFHIRNTQDSLFYQVPSSILDYLPTGAHMPSWAKDFLYSLAKGQDDYKQPALSKLFSQDTCSHWFREIDPEDRDTIWDLINNFPKLFDDIGLQIEPIQHIQLYGVGTTYSSGKRFRSPERMYYTDTQSARVFDLYARSILGGGQPDLYTEQLSLALDSSPRGINLDDQSRQNVRIIFDYANKIAPAHVTSQTIRDRLFKVRFDIDIDAAFPETGQRSTEHIWDILETLPDFVLGNPYWTDKLAQITKNQGPIGWWDPNNDSIHISTNISNDDFESTLRHEIAHGVQTYLDDHIK